MWRAWKLPNCGWREFLRSDSSSSVVGRLLKKVLSSWLKQKKDAFRLRWDFDWCFVLIAWLMPQDLTTWKGNDRQRLFVPHLYVHNKWVWDMAPSQVEICSGTQQMISRNHDSRTAAIVARSLFLHGSCNASISILKSCLSVMHTSKWECFARCAYLRASHPVV